MAMVHDLTHMSMEDAYDETQTNEEIRSGDVLLVRDGVAVLDRAWPVMLIGNSTVFHHYTESLNQGEQS